MFPTILGILIAVTIVVSMVGVLAAVIYLLTLTAKRINTADHGDGTPNTLRRFLGLRPHRTHYRHNGPVVINPDTRELIHVKG